MNYANKIGVPFVLFLGEDEIKSGRISCKNMVTGKQVKRSREQAVELILRELKRQQAKAIICEK